MLELRTFFHSYIDKLIEPYVGELVHLRSIITIDELTLMMLNDSTNVERVVCLKNVIQYLSEIEKSLLDAASLDLYKQSVDHLVYSLKLYVDDIKSLNTFYQ